MPPDSLANPARRRVTQSSRAVFTSYSAVSAWSRRVKRFSTSSACVTRFVPSRSTTALLSISIIVFSRVFEGSPWCKARSFLVPLLTTSEALRDRPHRSVELVQQTRDHLAHGGRPFGLNQLRLGLAQLIESIGQFLSSEKVLPRVVLENV